MFIRYNETGKYWEKDTSALQNGSGPWLILPIDYAQIYNPPATGYVNHASKHNTGGTDPITALSGGVINTGTVVDARLSSNVPLKDQQNVFTNHQIISSVFPGLFFDETDQPSGSRKWRILLEGQILTIQPTDDTGIAVGGGTQFTRAGALYHVGAIYERNRIVAMGEWQPYTPTWYSYTAGNGAIGNGVLGGRYAIVGKTVHYYIRFTVGSTSTIPASYFAFSLPVVPLDGAYGVHGYGHIRAASGLTYMIQAIPGPYYYGIANSIGMIATSTPAANHDAFVSNTSPMTWTTNDTMWLAGTYEMA